MEDVNQLIEELEEGLRSLYQEAESINSKILANRGALDALKELAARRSQDPEEPLESGPTSEPGLDE